MHKININRERTLKYLLEGVCVCGCSACCFVFLCLCVYCVCPFFFVNAIITKTVNFVEWFESAEALELYGYESKRVGL